MTDRQKQHLLGYLGLYTAEVDGIWGPLSIRATREFQDSYMEQTDGIFGTETEKRILEVISDGEKPAESFWEQIRYFAREEFRCTCCGRGCDGFPA